MPYFITDRHPDCSGWAVVKENGDMINGGCHSSKDDAIDHMVAASSGEGLVPAGEYEGDFRPANLRAEPNELSVGDFVRWDSSGGTAQGMIERIERDGEIDVPDSDFTVMGDAEDPAALIRIYRETENEDDEMEWQPTDTLVGHRFSTLTKISDLRSAADDAEQRQVDLSPPAYMRAAARRGLQFVEEGFGGDGLQQATIREARAMAQGNVTADKWVRIQAWIARHLVDLDAPAADPDSDDYPSPGVVAHLLWGSGPSKRAAERALAYAEGVVARLEEENEGRARGKTVAGFEVRVNQADFEVEDREDGTRFEGYAAVFNEPSRPIPGGIRGGAFTERISEGAFLRSLKSRNEIKLLWNHDTSDVLGSVRAGTLKLREDERGLRVMADLPNTSTGRDAAELLRRGDVDSMSFGFTVPKGGDDWDETGTQRTLREIMLHEVSIVAFPAYEQTAGTTSVRGLAKVAERSGVDVDALADALLKLENGEEMTADDTRLLSDVLDSIQPEATEAPSEDDSAAKSMLELKKKKLQLLIGGL